MLRAHSSVLCGYFGVVSSMTAVIFNDIYVLFNELKPAVRQYHAAQHSSCYELLLTLRASRLYLAQNRPQLNNNKNPFHTLNASVCSP